MRHISTILIALACLYLSRGTLKRWFRSGPKQVSAAVTKMPPCEGKKLCGVVYVAPWCPACNQLIPHLQTVAKLGSLHADYGTVVLVGEGLSMEENEAKAKEIGEEALTDNSGAFHEQLKIEYYPTFLVLDSFGHVHSRDEEAFNWINRLFAGP